MKCWAEVCVWWIESGFEWLKRITLFGIVSIFFYVVIWLGLGHFDANSDDGTELVVVGFFFGECYVVERES